MNKKVWTDESAKDSKVSFDEPLLDETRELASKLNKLNWYMANDEFPKLPRAKKDLMYEQQRAMSVYVQILSKRLELENIEFTHEK